jgi:hypothetical protein
LKSFGAGFLQSLADYYYQKKNKSKGKVRDLQREGAEQASLYCKVKMHYWAQGKATQGEKLIDLN